MLTRVLNRLSGTSLLVAAVALPGCAGMQAPSVPAPIQAPAGEKFAQSVYARGVQIYRCLPSKADATKNEWTFQAPEAALYSDAAMTKVVGKHYAGPTWEAPDGSKVVGEVKGNVAAADGFSIPWLLLSAKSTGGPGAYANIASIQRVDTKGGRAPQGGCSANQKDVTIRVNYTTVYHFYIK